MKFKSLLFCCVTGMLFNVMCGNKETPNDPKDPDTPGNPELPGIELLKNADFSDKMSYWRQYAPCKPVIITDPQTGKNAVLITEMSANWAVICQDITKPLNDHGRGTYFFGAKVKTNGGTVKIRVVIHYRDDTGRNWTHTDFVEINEKNYTFISQTAIINWSGNQTSEVVIYLQTEQPVESGLIIDSMTFRYVSDKTVVEGSPDVSLRNENPLLGVIRWDAWIGDGEGGAGLVVNRTLSPEKYHYRLPWFSKILGSNEVFIDGATQEIVDKEIQFAKTYGIDYFAILHYRDGMSFARKAYLNSLYRNGIKWCIILGGDYDAWEQYIEEFKKPYYLKTTDGRPVIYIFDIGSWMKPYLNSLRRECEKAGVPEPHIIGMNFDIPMAAMLCTELGLQGISLYTGGTPSAGCAYSAVIENDASLWQRMKRTGVQLVPQITSGWDKRPRYENPTPWEPDYQDFINQYAQQATPAQIAQNIANAFTFNDANKDRTVFNSVIVYAWNENDEGGWIVPTYFELRDSGKPLRLDAIREMLKARRAAYTDISALTSAEREAIENLAVAGVFENIKGNRFDPSREIGADEFTAYFIRSIGYWKDIETITGGMSRYDEALAIAAAFGINIVTGSSSITSAEAAQIAADIIKAADSSKLGDVKQLLNALGVNFKTGDDKLTMASAALLIYQLTKGIFDLPTTVE